MTPALYLAGAIILLSALGASLITIAATVWPNRHKIIAALQGRGGVE